MSTSDIMSNKKKKREMHLSISLRYLRVDSESAPDQHREKSKQEMWVRRSAALSSTSTSQHLLLVQASGLR